jgi:hypothetical protein
VNAWRAFVVVLASLALSACSGGGVTSDQLAADKTETTESAPAGGTATTVSDGAVEISVEVGVDSGPDRIETVALGSLVRITVVNEEDDDEVHLHGYVLGGYEVEAGEPTVFEFEASTAGEFEVESHVTGEVLMILVVR